MLDFMHMFLWNRKKKKYKWIHLLDYVIQQDMKINKNIFFKIFIIFN